VGQICYDLAIETGTECVTVTDEAIRTAQVALWQECRQLVEPAGATALAALMSGAYKPAPDERVAVLVCGGNLSEDPFG
jgi:threonine dehydratase